MVDKLLGMLNRFEPFKVLLLGDFMVDLYTTGQIERISPEAPVPIFHASKEESKPGGAGNVALNLNALGGEVTVMGSVGYDEQGAFLQEVLQLKDVNLAGFVADPSLRTPVKNRIIASNQQLIRIDHENPQSLSKKLEDELIERLPKIVSKVQVVAISDYGKGFLTPNLLSNVIKEANARKIPIIVDPKGRDFEKYCGATLIKPNFKEAIAAANLPDASLEEVAAHLLEISQAENIMITRSEKGISLFSKNGYVEHFPTKARDVKDVTGAGDTVLSMIVAAVANGLSIAEAARLSNVAGSITIKSVGCVHVTLSQLAYALFKENSYNKIFDEEHLFAVQEALRERDFIILGVHAEDGLSSKLFSSIRSLAGKDSSELIVYVRDKDPDPAFLSVLSSFREVSFIVMKGENLFSLCEKLRPNKTFIIENAELIEMDSAKVLIGT